MTRIYKWTSHTHGTITVVREKGLSTVIESSGIYVASYPAGMRGRNWTTGGWELLGEDVWVDGFGVVHDIPKEAVT